MRSAVVLMALALVGVGAGEALADGIPIPGVTTVSTPTVTSPVPLPTVSVPTLPTSTAQTTVQTTTTAASAPAPSSAPPSSSSATAAGGGSTSGGGRSAGGASASSGSSGSSASGGSVAAGRSQQQVTSTRSGTRLGKSPPSSVQDRRLSHRRSSASPATTAFDSPRTSPSSGGSRPSSSPAASGSAGSDATVRAAAPFSAERVSKNVHNPAIVFSLAAAILLLGVAALPARAIPDPRLTHVLVCYRIEVALAGAAAFTAALLGLALG